MSMVLDELLHRLLSDKVTVITPNLRMIDHLAGLVSLKNKSQNVSILQSNLIDINNWIRCEFEALNLLKEKPFKLIDKHQQYFIMHSIVMEHTNGLLDTHAATREIINAHQMMVQWKISYASLETVDQKCFRLWHSKYLDLMRAKNLIDSTMALQWIVSSRPKKEQKEHIYLLEFYEIYPLLEDYFEIAQYIVERVSITSHQKKTLKLQANSIDEEISQACYFVHSILQEKKDAVVCIVHNELHLFREDIRYELLEYFNPSEINIAAPPSIQINLIIETAFYLILLLRGFLSAEQAAKLLQSPFIIGADIERSQREYFAEECLKQRYSSIDNLHYSELKIWNKCISSIKKMLPKKEKYTTLEWFKIFIKVLQVFSWPGEMTLVSLEYQLNQKFFGILEEYLNFHDILKHHSIDEAIQILQFLISETTFLPEKSKETKVHVLGLLESQGLYFDAIWVLGMENTTLPKVPKPNPFLSLLEQEARQIPRSTHNRELQMAEFQIESFKRFTPHLCMSFTESRELGTSYCHLIAEFDDLEKIDIEKENHTIELELYEDDDSQSVLYNQFIKGGTRALETQLLCPFKAFSEIQLHLGHKTQPEFGISTFERGTFFHLVLERFWQDIKTIDALLELSEASLQLKIESIMSDIFPSISYPRQLKKLLDKIDLMMYKELVLKWLEFERIREPFVVNALESEYIFNIHSLFFKLRIDRLDIIKGHPILIDYKTTMSSVSNQTILNNIQLPIYLQAIGHVKGAYLAHLPPSGPSLRGFSLESVDDCFQNVLEGEDFHKFKEKWEKDISEAARGIEQGYAAVQPNEFLKPCARCSLQRLCRVKTT